VVYAESSSLGLAKTMERERADERAARQREWNEREDPWCMSCYGRSAVPCRIKGCVSGRIRKKVPVQAGYDTLRRRPIYVEKTVHEPCRNCNGKGTVTCPHCIQGLDRYVLSDAGG
jgi:hypothetical protein